MASGPCTTLEQSQGLQPAQLRFRLHCSLYVSDMEALSYIIQGDCPGMASIGCIRGAGDDPGCMVTCTAGGILAVHNSTPAKEPAHKIRLPTPLNCLAVNPAGTQVAVADDSHFVKV